MPQLLMFPQAKRSDRSPLTASEIPLPPEIDTPEVQAMLEQWLQYKTARGEQYASPASIVRILRPFIPMGPAAFCSSARHSMELRYQGIFAYLPEISERELSDVGLVLRWRDRAALDKTSASDARVVAAGLAALKGKEPVTLFRWICRGLRWSHVGDEALEEARRRLAAYKRKSRPADGPTGLGEILAGILR